MPCCGQMQSGEYEIVALLTTVNRDTHRSTMHGIPTALLQAQADSIGVPLHIVDLTPERQYGGLRRRHVPCRGAFQGAGRDLLHLRGHLPARRAQIPRESSSRPTASGSRNRSGENPPDERDARLSSPRGSGRSSSPRWPTASAPTPSGGRSTAAFMASLPAGVDPNGENGEYHTFCYDGPIFRTARPVPARHAFAHEATDIRLDDGSVKELFLLVRRPAAGIIRHRSEGNSPQGAPP